MRREEDENKEDKERDVEKEEEEVEERKEVKEREGRGEVWRKRRCRKRKSADCKKGTKTFAEVATRLHYVLTKLNNCNKSKAREFIIRQINGSKLSGQGYNPAEGNC